MHALTQLVSLPSIDTVIDFSPLTVTPDTSLLEAVALMHQQQASYVLVVENLFTGKMRVLGSFTDQDVMRLLCDKFDFQATTISQVMTITAISLRYSQIEVNNITVLLTLLQQYQLPLLPIVDKENQLVGIVTFKTIYQALQIPPSSPCQLIDTIEQLRLFESAVVNANDAIIITTADALDEPLGPRIVYVNEAFTRISGWSSAEVIGKTPRILQGELSDRTQLNHIRIALQNGLPVRAEIINYHKNGSTYWVEINIVPIADAQGKITHFVSVQRDITEQKQENIELETRVEERTKALQKSEERFRFLAESIPQQVWIAQPDGNVEYINQRIQNYLCCTQEEILGWKWQNWVHPEDLSKCLDAWQKSIVTGEPLELEFRWYRVTDRTYRWHLVRAVPQRDQDGKIVNWFGTNTDIHDLKVAEAALRQTQAQLQAILDNSPAIIYVVDTQNRFLLINSEYEKVFKFSKHQVKGKSIYKFFPHHIADEFARNNRNVLITGKPTEAEEIVPQDDGLHTYLCVKFPLKDANGFPRAICGISTDITDRKRTEANLRLRDRAIAASSNGIVICDARLPNLPIIYANPAFKYITGYSPEEVIGRSCRFLQGNDTNQPEIQELRNAIQQAKNCTVVLRNYRQDGSLFWNELSISPVFDTDGNCTHYVGIQNDITERKQSEIALMVSQQRQQYLLSATPAIIYTCKPYGDYDITFMSENVTAMLAYKAEEFTENSKFWSDRIHPEDKSHVFTEMINLFQQGEYICEYRFLHNNGNYIWVYDQSKLVRDDTGKPLEIVGYWTDINKRKQLEEELRTALEKEKELNELKSRFVTVISHEFRTPLSTILSSSELVEHYHHKWTEEKLLSHIHRIQNSVKHMTDMLNDVLVIGKAEVGRIDFKPTLLDLVEYCRDLLQELQQDVNTEHAIAFDCEYESISCHMDQKLLGHILRNLLTNAIKYSSNNSIITFTLTYQAGQVVVFEIKDKGIGIPQEDLPRLFESFHRAANVGNIPGTGLGLTIVKKCIDLQHGEIFVNSEVGVGTTFTVILPLKNL
ncbi:PAS domain S-box protein [Fischerella sp. JS2]|uniref:PAS domain S-box protein n=1 Tax=Fischerella sp. JS2 TaxID=2597771 RepID=UPI0028EDF829|nr:PAS domain S-box protein [Fischerella sp. JS2]